MLEDLEKEMEKRDLDAIVVSGKSTFKSPNLLYVSRTNLLRGGIYIKKIDGEEILIVSSIDLENARNGRVKNVKTYQDFGYPKLFSKYGKKAEIFLLKEIFEKFGVEKNIGIYGEVSASVFLNIPRELEKFGYSIKSESKPTLFDILRSTKDEYECREIERASRITKSVFEKITNVFSECKIKSRKLIYENEILTVGKVKSLIKNFSQKIDPEIIYLEGIIVAVGERGYNPHYLGEREEIILTNKPIVMDLYPRLRSGYYSDMTRTIIVGRASQRIKKLYEEVKEAQRIALDSIKVGISAKSVEEKVINYFKKCGHETYLEKAKEGYLHSLGHGIGLSISDLPNISAFSNDIIQNGNVFTLEPGLYYEKLGGIRIEDVVLVRKNKTQILSEFEKTLEI